jgi:uncharacterized protein YdcH (DUF465 family)
MDTRGKTNAEFRAEITETLGRHDANFDELNHNFNRVNDALQGVMAELQAMRIAHSHRSSEREVNPFAGEVLLMTGRLQPSMPTETTLPSS